MIEIGPNLAQVIEEVFKSIGVIAAIFFLVVMVRCL